MSETVIPQSTKQHHPGKNQKYVNSRGGSAAETGMTKNASIKHHNPEFFKRQTDRASNENVGRGVGKVGVRDSGPGANGLGPDRSEHSKGTENVGRGVGETGKHKGQWDSKKADNIPARKDVPIQHNMNHHQKNVGRDPGRGTGQIGKDSKAKIDNNSGMTTPQTNRGGIGNSSNPIRKSASAQQTNLPGGKKTDQNQMQMKQFTRGTMY